MGGEDTILVEESNAECLGEEYAGPRKFLLAAVVVHPSECRPLEDGSGSAATFLFSSSEEYMSAFVVVELPKASLDAPGCGWTEARNPAVFPVEVVVEVRGFVLIAYATIRFFIHRYRIRIRIGNHV